MLTTKPRIAWFVLAALTFGLALTVTARVTDIALWLDKTWFHGRALIDSRETMTGEPYVYGKTEPVALGAVADRDYAYFHLSLRFTMSDAPGYPNVFQTSDVNQGIRLEFSGKHGVVLAASNTVPGGVIGLPLAGEFEPGQTYALEVEALNHALVRVFIDGHRVAYYPGADLSFDCSNILVGRGFTDERRFVGSIDRIRLTKGSIRMGGRIYSPIYGTAWLLFLLSGIFLVLGTPKKSDVRALLVRIGGLAVPVTLILAFCEVRLSNVDTMYYMKRINLERQLDTIDTLILGSSNTVYGISPEKLSRPAYNLGFLGNETYLDARLVEAYAPRMKNLNTVVLNLNFLTTSLTYKAYDQNWRQFFMRQFLDVRSSDADGLIAPVSYWFDPRNFSKLAAYGQIAGEFIGQQHAVPFDIVLNKSGWFDSGTGSPGARETTIQGEHVATDQNKIFSHRQLGENLAYLAGTIDFLQKRNVRVVIVFLPTPREYYQHLDMAKFGEMTSRVGALAQDKNVKVLDYTRDKRFSLDDFAIGLVDHLNATGAERFSKILDQDLY